MIIEKKSLVRASSPEAVGVSSSAIADFVRDVEESNVEMHSFMVVRHGKVAYESWRKPYAADTPHTMYSVSKSVTSTALGFAISEGYLTLETKVLDVFPEYRPDKTDENLEKLTVRHLVTMTAGKDVSFLSDKTSKTWVKDFLECRWKYAPGESWSYISENTYVVAAILTKLTGMSVTEYLTPRLYEPLGIDVPVWERDKLGIETGGWGIFLKTEDLAKIALCYLQNGVFEGKQIIPAEWTVEATKTQADNSNDLPPDSNVGYGYFFWMNGVLPGSYRFDGMFSQFAIVMKEYDAIVITTNNEISEQKTRDVIWRHFPAAFIDEPDDLPEPCEIPEFATLEEIEPAAHSPLEKKLEGKAVSFKPSLLAAAAGYPLSVMCFAAIYMSANKGGPIDNVRFSFYNDEMTMYWRESGETNIIHAGMDGRARLSHMTIGGITYTASSSAAWKKNNELEIWIRPLEAVGQRRLTFIFKGDKVKLIPSSMPTLKSMSVGLGEGLGGIFPNPALQQLIKVGLSTVPGILEADIHGTIS